MAADLADLRFFGDVSGVAFVAAAFSRALAL